MQRPRKSDGSRAFSRAHAPCASGEVKGFSFGSWNCRALAHRTEGKMRAKVRFLRQLLSAVDVCVLQETHCLAFEADRILNVLRHEWVWRCSTGASRNAGGSMILIRKRLLGREDDLNVQEIIPGRITRSCMQSGAKRCIIWNVHNYDVSAADRREVNRRIDADRRDAQQDPGNVAMWLGGDFNFPPEVSPEFSLRIPSSATRRNSRRQAAEACGCGRARQDAKAAASGGGDERQRERQRR